jgi:hypothetical protein
LLLGQVLLVYVQVMFPVVGFAEQAAVEHFLGVHGGALLQATATGSQTRGEQGSIVVHNGLVEQHPETVPFRTTTVQGLGGVGQLVTLISFTITQIPWLTSQVWFWQVSF